MSENKQNQDTFDLWLSANLKKNCPVNPEFKQKVIHDIEIIKARQLLNRVIFQERLAKIALYSIFIVGICSFCCTPLLIKVYVFLESGFIGLIKGLIELPQANPGIITLVLLGFFLFAKLIWDKIAAEI